MIYLRAITKNDIEKIHGWRNDRELTKHFVSSFRFTNIEDDEIWFEKHRKNRMNEIRNAICLKENDEIIGVAYLLDIDDVVNTAKYSIMIGEKEFLDKGIGTDVTRLMLKHAFDDRNLNRIYSYILESNVRSIKMCEKIGFKTEGILRQAAFKDGSYVNLVLMSILREEFEFNKTNQ